MKILHIIQRYPPAIGGSELWCHNICRFLKDRVKGITVSVSTINLHNMKEISRDLLEEERYVRLGQEDCDKGVFIKRHKLWTFWQRSISSRLINFILSKLGFENTEIGQVFKLSPHSFEMYRKLFHEVKGSDIVHLHTLPYFHNIVGFYIAKLYKKKIVITPHFHTEHRDYEKKILFKIMNHCDAVIAVSNYEKDYLVSRKIPPDKIVVTGNAILNEKRYDSQSLKDIRDKLFKKYGVCEESRKVLFIGRKELYKGIYELYEAVEQLACEEDINLSFFLVGPGTPEFSDLWQSWMNCSHKVKLIDFDVVSDIEKEALLESCDILVLLSRFEAFGIVFLEAWKYGKPVIGSDTKAVHEVIKDAGLCAEYGNVDDLKEKIKKILFNENLARKLGEAGRKKLENKYSLDIIGEKVLNVYRSLNGHKKKVMLVSSLFPPYYEGGAEIVAYEQAKQLKKVGFDVRVFTAKQDNLKFHYGTRKEKNEFDVFRMNLHALDYSEKMVKIKNNKIQEKFREQLYDIMPGLVHFHNIDSFPLGIIDDCCDANIPTAMTLHDYWWFCYRKTFMRNNGSLCSVYNNGCKYCKASFTLDNGHCIDTDERNSLFLQYLNKIDLLISPSDYLAKKFIDRGISGDKIKVIKNGVDLGRFHYMESASRKKKLHFGFIGIIKQHKGIENLLKSVALLKKDNGSSFSVFIAGKGERLFIEYCKSLAIDLEIAELVHFLGERKNKDIGKVYKEIDVLVVPSIWPENSPVTIMDALATGTPVLASEIGGIKEIIQDGVHGYLHKYDDPVSLKENMKKVMDNPGVIKTMREACLKRARRLSLANQVGLIADEYNHLVKIS